MARKYSSDQREQYFRMTDQISKHWLDIFDEEPEFYSAVYWDLFTKLWRKKSHIRKTEAIKLMPTVSPATAAKHLQNAIKKEYISEMVDAEDSRARQLQLSPELRERLDDFLDKVLEEVGIAYEQVYKAIAS